MGNKDLMIYNAVANVAAAVFENIKCAPGKYAPADIAKYIETETIYQGTGNNKKYVRTDYKFKKDAPFGWAENYDPCQIHAVSVDTFSCSFNSWGVFSILKKCAAAWGIPAAYKCNFIRKADAAPVAVSFSVPAVCKDTIKIAQAVKKETPEKEIYTFVAVDTRRRCLITTNGNVITAVAVSDMFISEDAAPVYLISPELLKTGKGTVSIDTAGTAANDTGVSVPVADAVQFPRWARVLPAVAEYQRINIGNKVFKQLKKEITAVAKLQKTAVPVAYITGTAGTAEILIKYAISAENDTIQTRRIETAQPVPFTFGVPVHAGRFSAIPAAENIYICGYNSRYNSLSYSGANIVFTAPGVLCMIIPTIEREHENDYKILFPAADSVSAAEDAQAVPVLKVCNFLAAEDEETPAADSVPADSVSAPEDAPETAPAVAADSVPVQDEETAAPAVDAPAVETYKKNSAFYPWGRIDWLKVNHYMKIVATKFTYGRPYSDNSISQAETLLLNTGISLNEDTFVYCKKVIARIKKEMKKDICVSVDIVWLNNEETANVETAAADSVPAVSEDAQTLQPVAVSEDAQETAANVQDETPAVFAKVDQYAVNDENGNAVIFETYAPQLGTDEETAAPVPVDAQETAANVQDETPAADSVPAADIETLINNKFAAYLNDAPAVADSVPAVSEETAPAVQDAPAVAVSLPVPVSAVYPLHAVYIDNVLHGVYFSKLLADETFWAAFFAGRAVYDLEILSNETAPETERAAVARRAESCKQFAAVQDAPAVPVDEETPAVADSVPAVSEDAQETPANVQDEETAANVAAFVSVWACMPEIWQTDAPAVSEDAPAVAVDEETNAVPFAVSEDEETPAVANSRRRFRVWPWLIRAAAVLIAFISFAVNDAEKTPAVAVPVQDAQETPAAVSADSLAAVLFAVPEDAQETNDAPAVAVSVAADSETPAVADKQPQTAKKQPQTRRKRARRAESCKQFAPDAPAVVSVADSVPADSVPAVLFAVADSLAADSLAADSVPAVADSLAADSLANVETPAVDAPAVQDEETPAVADSVPAVDEETAPDAPAVADSVPAVPEDAPAVPADSVPADSVPAANSPAPAVPVAVTPYVIGCVFIH